MLFIIWKKKAGIRQGFILIYGSKILFGMKKSVLLGFTSLRTHCWCVYMCVCVCMCLSVYRHRGFLNCQQIEREIPQEPAGMRLTDTERVLQVGCRLLAGTPGPCVEEVAPRSAWPRNEHWRMAVGQDFSLKNILHLLPLAGISTLVMVIH